jgi:hypothetical protein
MRIKVEITTTKTNGDLHRNWVREAEINSPPPVGEHGDDREHLRYSNMIFDHLLERTEAVIQVASTPKYH